MSTDELKTMLAASDGKLILINTLPPESFAATKIPGSLNIPEQNDDFAAQVEAAAGSKNQPVVVYCASAQCRNSDIAAERLQHLGYAKVRVYTDGKKDWVDAGLAVESGPAQRRAA